MYFFDYIFGTFGHYDKQGRKTLNEREPFKFTFDQETQPGLNVKEVRDDVKFLREAVGVNHRGGINISLDRGQMAALTFQFALEHENPLVMERKETEFIMPPQKSVGNKSALQSTTPEIPSDFGGAGPHERRAVRRPVMR